MDALRESLMESVLLFALSSALLKVAQNESIKSLIRKKKNLVQSKELVTTFA
jgi:hypothetical protein